MILDKIVMDVKNRLAITKKEISFETMKQLALHTTYHASSFKTALQKQDIAIIAEVKKGSPSKGIIAENFDYLPIAQEYEKAGASAVSVLTERDNFFGDPQYLTEIKKQINLPVLRKDFIIDEYQLYEAKNMRADAILLIASILDLPRLTAYLELATSLQLDCLVEVHDEEELEKVLQTKADIIGINNRNLKTFEVNIQNTVNLKKLIPRDKIVVAESGIKTNDQINTLRQANINAVLIGETLMSATNKQAQLEALFKK